MSTRIGGTLLTSSLEPLARYFVRFVQAYEAAGVPIFAVTPQNEPRSTPADYPGMGMTAEEQATFVRPGAVVTFPLVPEIEAAARRQESNVASDPLKKLTWRR